MFYLFIYLVFKSSDQEHTFLKLLIVEISTIYIPIMLTKGKVLEKGLNSIL